MWLTGRLVPDHKTIADFRKDNGLAIRKVCARFVALCRELGLLTMASVAIDGSKFKAVNTRDKNFTRAKMERRLAQIEESVARYLSQLDTADLQEPSEALAAKTAHLKEKIAKLASEVERLNWQKALLGARDPFCAPDWPHLQPRCIVCSRLNVSGAIRAFRNHWCRRGSAASGRHGARRADRARVLPPCSNAVRLPTSTRCREAGLRAGGTRDAYVEYAGPPAPGTTTVLRIAASRSVANDKSSGSAR